MEQRLNGIWTADVELANLATQSFCAYTPANPLVAPSLHYELARCLQCRALDLKVAVEATNPIRYNLFIEEKHKLEGLEHEQKVARVTLKGTERSWLFEELTKLNQAEQTHKLASRKTQSTFV